MAHFVDAVTSHPEANYFRVQDSEPSDPHEWELEPLSVDLLSNTESDGYHVIKALNILPDGTTRECYIDMNLPERISDYAFFVDKGAFRFGYWHDFPGQFIPSTALDCFGVYELFYSRARPDLGIDILKRGLAIAKRKGYIAEDLGYILRDEGQLREAIDMFKISIEEGPSSYFIYTEVAGAYADLGDTANEIKYREMYNEAASQQHTKHAELRKQKAARSSRNRLTSRFLNCLQSLFRKRREDEPGWPFRNAHEGKFLEAILRECGSPSMDLAGFCYCGRDEPEAEPPKGTSPGPHRTLIYRRQSGVLYIWLHQVSGGWVCFESIWMPDGWIA
jgi:hypothetical protein